MKLKQSITTKNAVKILSFAMLIILLTPIRLERAKAESTIYIDLFTQKAPYDGKGINQPSDIFGPQETVELYAEVIECGSPIVGKPVTFEIRGPENQPWEKYFYRTAFTNSTGLAATYFRLQSVNESQVFGKWIVIASVEKDGEIYQDSLSFEVNWIVELISVRTVEANNVNVTGHPLSCQFFGIGGYVGIEIAIRNNAMIKRDANIAIIIIDELNVPLSPSLIQNLTLAPRSNIFIYCKAFIPKYAVPGKATLFVNALDEKMITLCPGVSTSFSITIKNPMFPDFTDVAVYILDIQPTVVEPGASVNVAILIRNEGTTLLKNITVALKVNQLLVAEWLIPYLEPYTHEIIHVILDTKNYSEGVYELNVITPVLTAESDLTDNSFTSSIEIKSKIHDVAVVSLQASPQEAYLGDNIKLSVTVTNLGDYKEIFNVTIFWGDTEIIATQACLYPNQTSTINIIWNTFGMAEGTHTIWALAETLPGEINTENNRFEDDTVTLLSRPTPIIYDLAVMSVQAYPTSVKMGQIVQIKVGVKNQGASTESFNVIAYYDNFPIAAQRVSMLPPDTQKELTFYWNTSGVGPGTYTIKAYIPPLPNEINTENNLYVNGNVTILPIPPSIIHDVAIRYVQAAPNIVFAGEVVQIRVDVENLGTTTENFTVITYYDEVEIATRNVDLLLPKATATLYFYWNTSGVGPGTYTIKAYIPPLPNEINTENNLYVNGNVTIKAPVKIHDVAILYVNVSKKLAYIGDTIQILVSAANLGDFPETFNVSAYYNESRMYIQKVSLNPKQTINITFNWDTSGLAAGSYIIWASAEIVPEEVNIENNCFVNGMVTLLSKPPPLIRDIAIVNLTANPSSVIVGENVTIKAVVADLGDFPETFNLTIFCEKKLIAEFTVNLQPHTEEAMTYIWNTSNVTPGVYKIWGNVTILENEINTENNFFENGKVTIKAPLPIQMLLEFLIPLAIVACLTLLALILFYIVARRRRRRRKRPKRSYALIVHKGI
jgi:hypothetical protein